MKRIKRVPALGSWQLSAVPPQQCKLYREGGDCFILHDPWAPGLQREEALEAATPGPASHLPAEPWVFASAKWDHNTAAPHTCQEC